MPAAWSKEAPLHRAAVRWLDVRYDVPRHGGGGFPFAGDARRRGLWGRLMQLLGATKGWPDLFIAARGASGEPGRLIEFKSKSGRLSAEQKAVGALLTGQGFVYFVVRDLETFQAVVDEYFTPLPGQAATAPPTAASDAQIVQVIKLQQKADAAQRGKLEAQRAASEASAESQQLRARCMELEAALAAERSKTPPAPTIVTRTLIVLD